MKTDSTTAQENQQIDQEWFMLMRTAKEIGLTTEEVRIFLQAAVAVETE